MRSIRTLCSPLLACVGVLFVCTLSGQQARAVDGAVLEKNFLHPPSSARPWVYWFWLNGNVTSNGITADLEAMRRVGIGGVLIMEVDQGAPRGPADFGSPKWCELFKHVCAEAHRLGLEVNMNNDAGWCGSGGPWITPDLAMQKVVWSETNIAGPQHFEAALAQPKAVSNYYRDIAVLAFQTPTGNARIQNIDGKAAFVPQHIPVQGEFTAVPADQTIPRDRIVDLTRKCDARGRLVWDVPAGNWTILRFGHTLTGKDNHPAPEPGRGLESDKLSKAATEVMFNNLMGKLISDSKALAGTTLVSTHIDSWETGSQNWTPLFRKEFRKRRGYDPLRFLPVMTGRVVDSMEISERFLWDLRQTVSDLLVENYSGSMGRLARERGLRLSIEAYDGTPCDDMTYAGTADEPMAEFWSWGYNTAYSCVEMSSAAHVYGKRILGAEAFTATDGEKWLLHPGLLKTLGDWAFCEGINRFVFHRYALQPWQDVEPGMSMGPWGLHYERTQTWWEQSAAWHEYLARCQYLLRQGLFVADLCFLEPEGSPMRFTPTMPWRTGNTPDRPRYDFDGCSAEVVLHRMEVKDGRLVLPDGMSYRALVLPQVETMTPTLLRRVKELVEAGAMVIGPPPRKSPSLSGYPGCDEEVQELARKTWGDGVPEYSSIGATPDLHSSMQHSNTPTRSPSVAAHRALWGPELATPQPAKSSNLVRNATWIWYPEGNPAAAAPPGKRYFRRLLVLAPEDKPLASARFNLTVDNGFELSVNGKPAGSGDNFKQIYAFDLAPLLQSGTNLLAVAAENTLDFPNPAGFIGVLQLKFKDGAVHELKTDKQWQTATNVPPNWVTNADVEAGWVAAMELGPFGMQPWNDVDIPSGPPYVFPDFQAVAGLLQKLGMPPDFEADPGLRFIHRRDGDTDIYFVANSQTNWLQANCGFRVVGKRPEVWDPMTGRMTWAAAFEEKSGRTFVPLTFEPAGSRFVLFREPLKRERGKTSSDIVSLGREGGNLLPEPGRGLAGSPPIELIAEKRGQVNALVWEPGRYELKTAAGKVRTLDLPALPRDIDLAGPWQVRFQPGRGAPEELRFPSLSDWSQHSDSDVKYFSGTATYSKSFTLSGELVASHARTYLDLGEVDVMAQVKLNGKDLGTLWKAPYRVEVTQALKSGENVLEVKVVNLWINRMIGDEQLPEDSDRNPNGTLKRWPDWLEKGEGSPTGRFTFTSWRLWKKDSPLQRSGLLGPVRIISAREMQVPGPR